MMIFYESDMPRGILYAYDGKVTIDDHLSGRFKPVFVSPNLIPIVGKVGILNGLLASINGVKLGDDGSARTIDITDLVSPLFSAPPTDQRVSGTKRMVELFVGTSEANFTHREIGIFSGTTLISTLVIDPEFEKTTAKSRTYIYSLGWD